MTMNDKQRFELLVEAESFENFGGWTMDSQFEDEMGSPYLLAHGIGVPCQDAETTILIPEAGEYRVWVRAKDWVPEYHPGRFQVLINGTPLDTEFGANGKGWYWEMVEHVQLPAGQVKLALHDLTGFDGRCDAIYITNTDICPPDVPNETMRCWRKRLLGMPEEPADGGKYDVVVVGGGVAGVAAAYAAGTQGCKTALVHNRPYLGGNINKNVGLIAKGRVGDVVRKLVERKQDGDIMGADILERMPNVTVFPEELVFRVITEGRKIRAIVSRNAYTSVETRFEASMFIDCTGRAQLGMLCGVSTIGGQEGKSDFNESLAMDKADDMHHGNTVLFRTEEMDEPVDFPEVPWAVAVAGDYADLNGQLGRVSSDFGQGPYENQEGPYIGQKKIMPRQLADGSYDNNRMNLPKSHFWEYGQWLNPYSQKEEIRDHLMCAIIGTYSNVRHKDPEKYKNLKLVHLGYEAATGGFRKYLGDYILTENDVRYHAEFPDMVALNAGAICLHYPGKDYDFRLGNWVWQERNENDPKPDFVKGYQIPYRCLYSADMDNLFAAGKHISMTHVAESTAKRSGNAGEHGLAVGTAAALCNRYNTTARGLGETHLKELQDEILDLQEHADVLTD